MYGEDIEAATRIDPADAPNQTRADCVESIRDLFQRLDLWNRGEWNGKWHDERKGDRRYRRAVFDSVVGQLELTDYQRMRAWNIMGQLSIGTRRGTPIALLTFVSAALAAREDGRFYHPQRGTERNDELFESVLGDLGFSTKHAGKAYGRVKGEIET